MLAKVISGGQSGADQAGWRAARRFGIQCSGWMPHGFLTEEGPRPEFAGLYGAKEHESPEYPPRTHANARDADATVWFGDPRSRGAKATLQAAKIFLMIVEAGPWPPPSALAEQFARPHWRDSLRVLNVAGNRESSAPGIGAWVEEYLCEVFRQLGFTEAAP